MCHLATVGRDAVNAAKLGFDVHPSGFLYGILDISNMLFKINRVAPYTTVAIVAGLQRFECN